MTIRLTTNRVYSSCNYYLLKIASIMVFFFSSIQAKEIVTQDFTIAIPDDWERIPHQTLIDSSNQLNSSAPSLMLSNNDYGFQKGYNNDYLKYPNLLIKIKNKGKLSKAEFRSWVDYSLQDETELFHEGLDELSSNRTISKMTYDKKRDLIWFETLIEGPENDIRVLSFIFQTEKGIIQLYGNCLNENFDKYKPIFWEIATSIQLSQNLKYDDNAFKKKSTYVLIFAFLIVYLSILKLFTIPLIPILKSQNKLKALVYNVFTTKPIPPNG